MTSTAAKAATHSHYGLEQHGLFDLGHIYWNLSTPALYEHALCNQEGRVAHLGPLAVQTGTHTDRSLKDKFIVCDVETEGSVWWDQINRPFEPENFDRLQQRLQAYLQHRNVYVQDCFAGAD